MKLVGAPLKELRVLSPGIGSLFVFADSADTPEDLLSAIGGEKQRCFFVVEDKDTKESEVSIVSLDGAQILRRSGARLVINIPVCNEVMYRPAVNARLSNVENGMEVILPTSKNSVYFKVMGNPTPQGKVLLVNLNGGAKVLIDDDTLVKCRNINMDVAVGFK